MLGKVDGARPHILAGPLLRDFIGSAGTTVEDYVQRGGYQTLRARISRGAGEEIISAIEDAGLRGRAGGGFPTSLKWAQVARSAGPSKFFVCNAHAGQPGGIKERFLLSENPHRILEAVSIGAFAVGAEVAIIYLGHLFLREELQLSKALGEAKEAGYLGGAAGGPDIFIYRSPGGYISGEETAIFELIEGRPGRPRGKPPVPTREGILGSPTVVNNLETLLHALFIIEHGPDRFREAGTPNCPGTLLFSLSGQVERPGLYELGLGTSLRQLVLVHGGGGLRGRPLRAVLPGGLSSRLFGPESLDIDLDYDSMRDAGADLGAGAVIVVTAEADVAALTLQLARFYHENSCGKCQPCKDGTGRTLRMLERLEYLDQTSIDIIDRPRPPSSRSRGLVVLDERGNEPGGISYTDTVKGLSKIKHLCDWYEFRGDCHHSAEAARAIRSAIDLFESDLNA